MRTTWISPLILVLFCPDRDLQYLSTQCSSRKTSGEAVWNGQLRNPHPSQPNHRFFSPSPHSIQQGIYVFLFSHSPRSMEACWRHNVTTSSSRWWKCGVARLSNILLRSHTQKYDAATPRKVKHSTFPLSWSMEGHIHRYTSCKTQLLFRLTPMAMAWHWTTTKYQATSHESEYYIKVA